MTKSGEGDGENPLRRRTLSMPIDWNDLLALHPPASFELPFDDPRLEPRPLEVCPDTRFGEPSADFLVYPDRLPGA